MDLRLEVAEGCQMPTGSFLAVKLGDALKQGRYEPSRTYQFPNVDKKRHAKIDVFKHVGSAAVLVSPEAGPHVSEVAITSSCPLVEDLRLKVNMIPMGGKDSDPPKSTIRVKAQSYLEKHGIEEKLSCCMKLLLQQRPNNPIDFICCNLRGDDEILSPPVACCDVETQTDAVNLAFQSEDLCNHDGTATNDGQDDRELVRGLLAQASADGSLLEMLQQDAPPDKDVRLKARNMLTKANADGNLLDILMPDVPRDQELRQDARRLLTKANRDGNLLQLLQENAQDSKLESLRLETRDVFSSAVENGSLMEVLAENRRHCDELGKETSIASTAQGASDFSPSPSHLKTDSSTSSLIHFERPLTSESRVSTDTFEGAATDAASLLVAHAFREDCNQIAETRAAELQPVQRYHPGVEKPALDPRVQFEGSATNASEALFWGNLYDKFPQPGMEAPPVAKRITSMPTTHSHPQSFAGPSGIAQPQQQHMEAQLERERLNTEIMMETQSLIAETKALITGDDTIQHRRNQMTAPQTEVTANRADLEYSRLAVVPEGRSEPAVSSEKKTAAADTVNFSGVARNSIPEKLSMSSSTSDLWMCTPSVATWLRPKQLPLRPCLQAPGSSMKPNAHSCPAVPSKTPSRKSWAAKPSVATWLRGNPGELPRRRNWACKPSVGTWLQQAPEDTESC